MSGIRDLIKIFQGLSLDSDSAAKSLQSPQTPCNPIDVAHQAPSGPRNLQPRILEWVAISFSNACMLSRLSRVRSVPPCGQQPSRLLHPQDSPGKNTGVSCHFLPQDTDCRHALDSPGIMVLDSRTVRKKFC